MMRVDNNIEHSSIGHASSGMTRENEQGVLDEARITAIWLMNRRGLRAEDQQEVLPMEVDDSAESYSQASDPSEECNSTINEP